MRRDPTAAELLEAVCGWLGAEDAAAGGFHRRVARNVIDIVRRELALWPTMEAEAVQRMAALLGHEGTFVELEAELAEAIRTGRIAEDDPGLRDHLKRTALDALAVDQPRYVHELTL